MKQKEIFRTIRILSIHLLLWSGVWFSLALLMGGSENLQGGLKRTVFIVVGQAALVYFNTNFLFPAFFRQKRYLIYFLAGIISVLMVTYISTELYEEIFEVHRRPGGGSRFSRRYPWSMTWIFFTRSFPFFIAFIFSSAYKLAAVANTREKEAIKLQKDKLETEMKFLKSQTNPHFLFNALHNIYALSLLNSPKTPDYLLKLSEMLRYMLYECNAEKVPLRKEIEYLQNYIDLKMLKDSRGLGVSASFDNSRPEIPIAPMLFVPFIENAFKHSKIEDIEKGWIKIILTTTPDTVSLEVSNSQPKTTYTKDPTGGIGLQNVKRQLELIYPDRHSIEISETQEAFSVALKINWK